MDGHVDAELLLSILCIHHDTASIDLFGSTIVDHVGEEGFDLEGI